jgi:hypothetical protein
MKQATSPLSRHLDIIVQELDGEIIVYDLKTDKAYCLNETSALIWQLCDGKTSVSEISRAIGKRLNTPANEDLVWMALDQLKEQNLLSGKEEIVSKFDGISRREVIRRVGLGTMIALPLITSLVAPKAINAQSVACSGSCVCTKGNINSFLAALCKTELGGTSGCANRSTCDCLVVGGLGSTGGTCQGT